MEVVLVYAPVATLLEKDDTIACPLIFFFGFLVQFVLVKDYFHLVWYFNILPWVLHLLFILARLEGQVFGWSLFGQVDLRVWFAAATTHFRFILFINLKHLCYKHTTHSNIQIF